MGYVSRRRTGSSGYVSRRVSPGAGGKPKKKGGPSVGGFLGNIGGGLKDLAVGSAIGAVHVGKGVVESARERPWSVTSYPALLAEPLFEVGKAAGQDIGRRYSPLVRGDIGEFAHLLYEEPVPFALDIGAVASAGAGTAARGVAAGRALGAGRGVRAAGRAVRHGPETELRYAKLPESEAKLLLGTYSRAALTRRTQKFMDSIRQRFPNAEVVMGRSLYRKVGFQQARLAEIEERLGRAQVGELQAKAGGRKLSASQHRALRVVGEGVPLDVRIARHRADLVDAKDARQARKLRGEIRLLEKTRRHLDETGALKDPKLQEIYNLVRESAGRREDILAAVDELAPERAAARVGKPAELFGEGEGETFFTYADRKRPTTFARLGASRTIRHPRKPGTTQEFTGKAITQGRIPRREAIVAAEAELEAWRFSTILRHRDRLEALGKPLPTKDTDVALVLDELRGKRLPEEARAFLDKAATSRLLPEEEVTALARIGDGLRQQIFPGQWRTLQESPEFRAAMNEPIPGVVWIDERLLGGLHSSNPLMAGFSGNEAARRIFRGVDAVNNAEKAALLYILPLKYITPNLISQTAFALIQQGFAAPINLTTAARLNSKLGKKATAAIDGGMGEGFAASIANEQVARGGLQALAALNTWAARNYGKLIDLPFRRAAFLHEAKRAGFTSTDDIMRLLFEPELRDRRLATFLEANSEIIDYARLGRFERNIVRRLIFFYPWVKGATVYGARFLIEHPGKAWVLDQLGKIGNEVQAEELGTLLPSYAEALAPIGTSGGLPTTVNLAAVSPFTTPYQVLRGLTGDRRSAYALGSQFSPAVAAGIMGAGFTPPGGYEAGPGAAFRELYEGTPQSYYGRRILEGSPERAVYPTTLEQNIRALLFGTGVTPRRTNPQRLAEEAQRGR